MKSNSLEESNVVEELIHIKEWIEIFLTEIKQAF